MTSLFLKILDWGIAGTWLILAVLLLRFIFGRISRRYICILWIFVGLNLLFPFVKNPFRIIPSDFSSVPERFDRILDASIQDTETTASPPGERGNANTPSVWLTIGGGIWTVGMLFFILFALIRWFRIKKALKVSLKVYGNVWICDSIEQPFVFGFLKAKIYLPSQLSPDYAGYIVQHEETHIRRLDHISRVIAYGILAIYWFQPFVWIFYLCFCKDTEFACDEKVVQDMSAKKKKEYLHVLLSCSTSRPLQLIRPVSLGGANMKKRILHTLRYKKPRTYKSVFMLIFALLILFLFTGNSTGREIQTRSLDFLPFSFGFNDLEPGNVQFYSEKLKLKRGDRLPFQVLYYSMGLDLEVELLSDSGSSEVIAVTGGSGRDAFQIEEDGDYQVLVRNSEENKEYEDTAIIPLMVTGVITFSENADKPSHTVETEVYIGKIGDMEFTIAD